MSDDQSLSESDHAFAALISLVLGSISIDPQKGEGVQSALTYLRDEFASKDMTKAKALIEYVRQQTDLNAQGG